MPRELTDLTTEKDRRDWRWKFLGVLAETGCVVDACLAVRKSRWTVYSHRERFPKFRAKWDEAIIVSGEVLESIARKRAINPKDPGSTTLLIFLMKGANPGKYRETYRPAVEGPARSLAEIADEAEAARAAHIPESKPEGLK